MLYHPRLSESKMAQCKKEQRHKGEVEGFQTLICRDKSRIPGVCQSSCVGRYKWKAHVTHAALAESLKDIHLW